MRWCVDPELDVQPSRQLVLQALDAVAAGELEAGRQLPSVRALAAEALVNPNTAARAWRELEGLGVARAVNGRGVFVADEGPRIARELRRAATRDELVRAFRTAVRAGHDPEALLRELADQADRSPAPSADSTCPGTQRRSA